MKCLTDNEVRRTLQTWGIDLEASAGLTWRWQMRELTNTAKTTIFVKSLLRVLPLESAYMLHITGTGVWGDSENLQLAEFLRSAWGESRTMREAPGHLFTAGEEAKLECMLDLVLYYGWDAVLADEKRRFIIETSHAGKTQVVCVQDLQQRAEALLTAFEADDDT
jgi:hypothetical protein